MKNRTRLFPVLLLGIAAIGCQLTGHPVMKAQLGVPRSALDLESQLAEPGPIDLETIVAADWQVQRSGLVNLDHPRAVAEGLTDGTELIQIYFHALRHPQHGLFIVDTGVERALAEDQDAAAIRGLVAHFMDLEALSVRQHTAGWLAAQPEPLAGVFMTHLHLDHVSGMPDVPSETPVYMGPGETADRSIQNLAVAPNISRAIAGKGPLREWAFMPQDDGPFESILDIFGDGSVFALHVPGHTPGSTAYLVRTTTGPVLLVGDACHTRWGWQNGVEPGSFSSDQPHSRTSLERLRKFVARHPGIEVRLGHQPFGHALTVSR